MMPNRSRGNIAIIIFTVVISSAISLFMSPFKNALRTSIAVIGHPRTLASLMVIFCCANLLAVPGNVIKQFASFKYGFCCLQEIIHFAGVIMYYKTPKANLMRAYLMALKGDKNFIVCVKLVPKFFEGQEANDIQKRRLFKDI